MNNPLNILFPIETINRELDFRLFLAAMYANSKRKIWIGQHDTVHSIIDGMRTGLYVGKNIFKTEPPANLAVYNKLHEQDFRIVYLHEEGAFYLGNEDDWRKVLERQYDVNVFNDKDFICTWGRFQAEANKTTAPQLANNIRVTGHPRFDLYKPEYRSFFEDDIKRLQARFGDYILFNSNFSLANHGQGNEHVFSPKGGYNVNDEQKRMQRVKAFAHTSEGLMRMMSLLHEMAIRFPELNVIIRPHPSENHSFHKTVFAGVKNIHVVHEGPVGPWIMAAKALIHDGCTTAIEASLAKIPVITYKPEDNAEFDQYIPNLVGRKCRTKEEVFTTISAVVTGEFRAGELSLPERAQNLFYNFSNDSFKALIEVMEEAEKTLNADTVQEISEMKLRTRLLSRNLALKAKKNIYIFDPTRKNAINYHQTKFYGFSPKEIGRKVERLEVLLKKKLRLKVYNKNLLSIE